MPSRLDLALGGDLARPAARMHVAPSPRVVIGRGSGLIRSSAAAGLAFLATLLATAAFIALILTVAVWIRFPF